MLRRKIKRKPKAKKEETTTTPDQEEEINLPNPEIKPDAQEAKKAKRQRLDSSSSAKGVYKNRSRKNSENVTQTHTFPENITISASIQAPCTVLPPVEEILNTHHSSFPENTSPEEAENN